MVMDYVAYRDDLEATRHGQMPGNPFFARDVVVRRWTADSPRAGFSSPDEMFQFMRAGVWLREAERAGCAEDPQLANLCAAAVWTWPVDPVRFAVTSIRQGSAKAHVKPAGSATDLTLLRPDTA